MDLSKIKPAERVVEIKAPWDDGELIGLRIGLMSASDERMKEIKRAMIDKRQKYQARGKDFKALEIEENQNTLIFKAMTSWEWYNPTGAPGDEGYDVERHAEFEGEKSPKFNAATVLKVLSSIDWVKKQLIEELEEEKSFFEGYKSN